MSPLEEKQSPYKSPNTLKDAQKYGTRSSLETDRKSYKKRISQFEKLHTEQDDYNFREESGSI